MEQSEQYEEYVEDRKITSKLWYGIANEKRIVETKTNSSPSLFKVNVSHGWVAGLVAVTSHAPGGLQV